MGRSFLPQLLPKEHPKEDAWPMLPTTHPQNKEVYFYTITCEITLWYKTLNG